MMERAIDVAETVRLISPPNPWVGCVIVAVDGSRYEGATEAAGGRHAEIVALDAAGDFARGATAYVTLEPCAHQGRTGPCTEALIQAGIAKVVIGPGTTSMPDDEFEAAAVMFKEAGVKVVRA